MVNPIYLILFPVLASLFIIFLRRWARIISFLALSLNLFISLFLVVSLKTPFVVNLGGWKPPFCISLFASSLSIFLSLLVSFIGLCVVIYSFVYIKDKNQNKFYALLMLLFTGMYGIVLTADIFNMFVFFEILCISSYVLVAYNREKESFEAAFKYLVQGSVASVFILIAIGIIYGLFGTLNLADIAQKITYPLSFPLKIALGFFIAGFGVEAAIFPLNAWLPDAHSSAPSPISAVLSGIAIEVGIYAVARVVFTIFGASGIFPFFVLLGLVTLLVGELSAFSQNNIKRLLAYSSIGQIGLILFALGIGTNHGVEAGLFQIITHALSKVVLFLSVGYMIYRAGLPAGQPGSMEISSLQGMGKKMPLTSLAFTIGAFSLIGLPPFVGFGSKFMIVRSALETRSLLYTVFISIVLLGTIIEGAYFFRVIQALYFKSAPVNQSDSVLVKETSVTALIPIVLLVLLIIGIGIYPKLVTGILNSAAGGLLDRIGYIKGVLGS